MTSPSNDDRGKLSDDAPPLLFERSPYGNVDAIVQHEFDSIYFYLNGPTPFGTRACWVRNLAPGPYVLDKNAMSEGRPPMMPRTHCHSPQGDPFPAAEELSIVWFEEGNGAALLENDEMIAVIPPWSGIDGFHGYSAACASENELGWPMPPNPQLNSRISRAIEFWKAVGDANQNEFGRLQERILEHVASHFGVESSEAKYFAIDGGTFPPRGLQVFRYEKSLIAMTVGMSLCPQPNVEMHVDNPGLFRRIELGVQLKTNRDADELSLIWQGLAGLASYPWKNFTWLGHGHTCELKALTDKVAEAKHVLLVADQYSSEPIRIGNYRNDPINLLWLVPIDQQAQNDLEANQISADKFSNRLRIKIG